MKSETIAKLTAAFEGAAQKDKDVEYWMARDLQELLDYDEWRNFLKVIERAKTSCQKFGRPMENHFVEVNKMVLVGSGSSRAVEDIILSRYACYLIAQNGDPRKETIAFAQGYFALQTRKQELLEKHIANLERLHARQKLTQTEKELSSTLYEHGVDDQGFARVRSKGDQALFGGHSTNEMKRRLSVPESRPLADFLPTITIKAKDFAGEITNFKVKQEDLRGESQISEEHVKNNQDVRRLLAKRGIYPEELPAEEDIKKLEKKIKKQNEVAVSDLPELTHDTI